MDRQHSVPLLLTSGPEGIAPLKPVSEAITETYIQKLVHQCPACLPIAEIDAIFAGPVPICTELNTPAGPIDNFMVTPSGLPLLVECKLLAQSRGTTRGCQPDSRLRKRTQSLVFVRSAT